ncbi:coiled-coil domain-containing protein [Leifsonia sp. LS-T14]|uniref:coiled-coil domain-containing protein n=1 Tax=unclassified Leifsonia TaxID=2663824 RepID=UPI0035A6FF3A
MRRLWKGSAVAAALTVALVVAGGAAPASADSYPSWSDVQAAKNNAAAAQAEVDRINGLLQGLQNAADAAGDLAVKRLGEYGSAETALQAATARAQSLSERAHDASVKADELKSQSGKLAEQLTRAGTSSVSLRLFLSPNASSSESLLYQLGAVSKLADRSSALFAQASAQKNVASSLSAQAANAQTIRDQLATAAKKALDVATAAKQAADAQLADQKQHADTLYAQLASLKNTQASVEQQYAAGEAAKAAAAAAANPGGGSDGFAPPPGMVVDPAGAQAYAASRLGAYGWGSDQMPCLIKLWNHESGWRADAYNTSSGAYGIPQAWRASRMASAGPDWLTNQNTQVNWGLDYINGRYGSPCAAWAFEMSHDPNWY